MNLIQENTALETLKLEIYVHRKGVVNILHTQGNVESVCNIELRL